MSLKDEIPYHDLETKEPSNYWTTVLYAETGKRKTTTACSMIIDKGLLISADDSWKVLKKDIHTDLRQKTTLIEFDSAGMFDHIDYKGYDTVICDTFTSMVDRFLDLLYDEASWGGKYRETLVTKNEFLKGTSTTAPIDYKVTRDKFRPIIHSLIRLPAHKIFLMHPNDPIPGLTKDPTRKPRLPGATWQILAEFADVIGFIEGQDKKGFTVNVDESSTACIGKSRIQGISGRMPLERFIDVYSDSVRFNN